MHTRTVKVKYKQNVDNPPDVNSSAIKRYTWAMQSLAGNKDPVEVNLEYSEDSNEVAVEVSSTYTLSLCTITIPRNALPDVIEYV